MTGYDSRGTVATSRRSLKGTAALLALAIAALILALFMAGCRQPATTEGTPTQPDTRSGTTSGGGRVIKVSEANFQSEVLDCKQPVLMDFGAPWCGPCRVLEPILESLAKKYAGRAKIVSINVDDNRSLARKYVGRGIPTLVLLKGGKELYRREGISRDIEKVLAVELDKALRE